MPTRRSSRPVKREFVLAGCATVLLAAFAAPVQAQQSSIIDELIEKLKVKGILSEEEYAAMKAARDEERAEQRAERRKQVMKTAQDEEKKEKTKEDSKLEAKGRFKDGFTWETGDKSASIALNGRIQADYRSFSPSDLQANTFDIRRAYLGVNGRFYNDYTFEVTADLAQTTAPQLDVAWINWGPYKPAQLRIGQFKMPFSLEELTSSRFIDFQERSFVNAFVPAKERGAMIHGQPYTGVNYGLAMSNGQGKNNNEIDTRVDGIDVIGRATVNIAEIMGDKNAVYHLGAAYSQGELPTSSTSAAGNLISVRTEGRGATFFQVANSTLTGDNVERQRMGVEASVAYGPVKVQGEYLDVGYSGTSAAGVDYDRDVNSYYAEVLWLITGEKYADSYRNGTYGRISPKDKFSIGASGWGAWELGLRYSSVDGSDFTTTNPVGTGRLSTGFTNAAEAWTLGLKWIVNPNTRFMLNYVKTEFDTPVTVTLSGVPRTYTEEEAITLRAAFDF